MKLVSILKSKIHGAKVTAKNVYYQGSITIGKELIKKADLQAFERVEVYNMNNGARFSTYVIEGEGEVVELNGAAARLGEVGDPLIIVSYMMADTDTAAKYRPVIIKR